MARLSSVCCVLILLIALPARADELRLTNGDRITGTTVALAGGNLTFKASGGDLKIPWNEVAGLLVDMPIMVTVGSAKPLSAILTQTVSNGQVNLVPGGPVALMDIAALERPHPEWVITGGAGAGIIETSGNTSVNNVRVSGDFVARSAADRYTVSVVTAHANDRGMETARNWLATGKYDLFLTDRLYANASADFTNDRFRDIDLRTALGVGLGYQVIDNGRTTLTADGGLAWVNENFRFTPDDSYTAVHESANLKVEVVRNLVQLFHLHDGYFNASGQSRTFVRTQNGVRFSLAAGFVTTIEEDLDYDRSPSPGRKSTDRTFSLTLGYRF